MLRDCALRAEEILRNIKEAKPTRIRLTQRIVKPIGVATVALAEAGPFMWINPPLIEWRYSVSTVPTTRAT